MNDPMTIPPRGWQDVGEAFYYRETKTGPEYLCRYCGEINDSRSPRYHKPGCSAMTANFQQFIRRILSDLACSVLKQDEVPCSAELHFHRAMTDLSALIADDLDGLPQDLVAIIGEAREHMAVIGYQTHSSVAVKMGAVP